MRGNRKGNQRKERIIMLASSVLVLTALTMTGIYMQNEKQESQDDGYTLDFTVENTPQKNDNIDQKDIIIGGNPESELDYMPLEAGSNKIQIPGVTDVVGEKDPKQEEKNEGKGKEQKASHQEKDDEQQEEPEDEDEEDEETAGEDIVVRELNFSEEDGLLRPVEGEVLLPFSMDHSVYFRTLDQYKYNPAVMLRAEEGTPVAVAAEGKVVSVFEDAQMGCGVTVDLGNGYQMTYGQLKEISVAPGNYVDLGAQLAVVAAPTKYFSLEGANLYLQLTKDGIPVNPESLFR